MEKFDISYRLDGDETHSLVPQLVPHQRPALPWQLGSAPQAGIRSLALTCRLSESAPGLIPWLTVRHHRASTGIYWRRGVFLRHPIDVYRSEALLELRRNDELAL
jgi:internalin A